MTRHLTAGIILGVAAVVLAAAAAFAVTDWDLHDCPPAREPNPS